MNNCHYLEERYACWQNDPAEVGPAWDAWFRNFPVQVAPQAATPVDEVISGSGELQSRVDSLLWAFRNVGYMYARLNPLGGEHLTHEGLYRHDGGSYEALTPEAFGISESALGEEVFAGKSMQPSPGVLREVLSAFRQTYCGAVGVEFLHIQNRELRSWLMDRMESCRNVTSFSRQERERFYQDILHTETLEKFLGTHFIGQKRFSLEGAEGLIPALHDLVDTSARANDIDKIIIGTTHRGRLSILHTVLGMTPVELFAHLEGHLCEGAGEGGGDVPFHVCYEATHAHEDGSQVEISLAANPSHLESVSPVVQGKVRALQDALGEKPPASILPVLLHGDAAFAGQGVVAETINLSQLHSYSTGGTVHIIINNQIGFTTAPMSARSSIFPTDMAKMLSIPIFHVNGDRPEAVVHALRLALAYRQLFARDAIVDMLCFRRHGHNEEDDPSYTHPQMYRVIDKHPGVASLYGEICERDGVVTKEQQEALGKRLREELRQALNLQKEMPERCTIVSQGEAWNAISRKVILTPVETAVPVQTLQDIHTHLTTVPEDFPIHPKLRRILERKSTRLQEDDSLDWASAESLAFGALLRDGVAVRLSGQDVSRGTFSQRHLLWWDYQGTAECYSPLAALPESRAGFQAVDSPLSEYAALGFEYGYSLVDPHRLVIWEAQFGDFSDGAQVIIDNFIASGQSKWNRCSGLVMLLPHGMEGQGPEHSTARVERWLQLCARDNLQACNLTRASQYFHLLRRQMLSGFRRPLVIFSPKSLLRHPQVACSLADLSSGTFQRVLQDPDLKRDARRVCLCSGKVFYDLLKLRQEEDLPVALIRLEQLYPFPEEELRMALDAYPQAEEFVWVQEEHRNAGAWQCMRERFLEIGALKQITYVGRDESPSAATGAKQEHNREQEEIVRAALSLSTT